MISLAQSQQQFNKNMSRNLSQTYLSKEYVIYTPQVLRFIYTIPFQNQVSLPENPNPKYSKKQSVHRQRKHKIALISKEQRFNSEKDQPKRSSLGISINQSQQNQQVQRKVGLKKSQIRQALDPNRPSSLTSRYSYQIPDPHISCDQQVFECKLFQSCQDQNVEEEPQVHALKEGSAYAMTRDLTLHPQYHKRRIFQDFESEKIGQQKVFQGERDIIFKKGRQRVFSEHATKRVGPIQIENRAIQTEEIPERILSAWKKSKQTKEGASLLKESKESSLIRQLRDKEEIEECKSQLRQKQSYMLLKQNHPQKQLQKEKQENSGTLKQESIYEN